MNKYIVMTLILILLALAVLICYAALVTKTNADELEEEYWQNKTRNNAREGALTKHLEETKEKEGK